MEKDRRVRLFHHIMYLMHGMRIHRHSVIGGYKMRQITKRQAEYLVQTGLKVFNIIDMYDKKFNVVSSYYDKLSNQKHAWVVFQYHSDVKIWPCKTY